MRYLAETHAGIAVLIWGRMPLVIGSLSIQCERQPFISLRHHFQKLVLCLECLRRCRTRISAALV